MNKKELEYFTQIKKENKALRNMIEGWYDTVKDLCDACEDTSYKDYLSDYEEITNKGE